MRLIVILVGLWVATVSASFTITLPSTQSPVAYDPETGDSVVVCDGPITRPTLSSLNRVRLWGYPSTGGLPRVLREDPILNTQAGLPYIIDIPLTGSWMLWVTTLNSVGESCPSNTLRWTDGTVTGVEPPELELDEVVWKRTIFSVQGRVVRHLYDLKPWDGQTDAGTRAAHGVYFEKRVYLSGREVVKRVVNLGR